MTVPRILYQTWKTKDIPSDMVSYRKMWLDLLQPQGWDCPLLTDEDLRTLVVTHFPEYEHLYDSFTKNIQRVDFSRYVMMYLGGVYADLDTYPVRPIDKWVDMNQIILGEEPPEHANTLYNRKQVICNAFMISPPGQDFWKRLMAYIAQHYTPDSDPVYTTGPLVISKFKDEHPDAFQNVVVTDACMFFPLTSKGEVTKGCSIDDMSYVVHKWHNTWVSEWLQKAKRTYSEIKNNKPPLLLFLVILLVVVLCL